MIWSNHREIIEFKQTRFWRPNNGNDYYFRKINNRWHWGRQLSSGIMYDEHPYATQREARKAASDWDDGKQKEVKEAIAEMRAIAKAQGL